MAQKKLLVADDSLTIQKVIRLALTNEGYEIHSVSEGKDALQQITLFRPDAVLLDVSLPEKSAFEIRRELLSKPEFQNIKAILMSSAFEKVDEVQVKELRFDGRLTKPFDPAHLRKILQEALSGSDEIPPPPPSAPEKTKTLPALEGDLWAGDGGADNTEGGDIKRLTESTIRMSGGVENFEWTLNESAKKPKEDFDLEFSPPAEEGESEIEKLRYSEPRIPAFTRAAEIGLPPHEIELDESKAEPTEAIPPFSAEVINLNKEGTRTQFSSRETETTRFTSPALSASNLGALGTHANDEIEMLVKKQVEEVLHKMAQKMLPEMAEKMLKQEIHRLLSE